MQKRFDMEVKSHLITGPGEHLHVPVCFLFLSVIVVTKYPHKDLLRRTSSLRVQIYLNVKPL